MQTLLHRTSIATSRLTPPPTEFFMSLRDVAFWIRSARADLKFDRLRRKRGAEVAFDHIYAEASDPFGAELPQYRYQQRKYHSLLSLLPKRPYGAVLDIGCGLGAFTRKLAPFAKTVLGTDVSMQAVLQARRLSTHHSHLTYEVADVLTQPGGEGTFDLIVVADVLYYIEPLTEPRIKELAVRLASKLTQDGLILLVNHHFFGFDRASKRTRAIHGMFQDSLPLHAAAEFRRAFFLATVLTKGSPAGPA